MRILVACEESQRVCTAFRNKGHEAYSCDIMDCSGDHPEWHIKDDVMNHINEDWDMIIAFPPCTHLCNAGQRWFAEGKKDRKLQEEAIRFFMAFTDINCPKISIENPVGIMSTKYRKPDQIIHPWMFGDTDYKMTCLWLKGLPKLKPTNIVPKEERTQNNWKAVFNGKQYSWNDPDTSILRSKTYKGIAEAMAEQWG